MTAPRTKKVNPLIISTKTKADTKPSMPSSKTALSFGPTAPAKTISPMDSTLQELGTATEKLAAEIAALVDQLKPVCNPDKGVFADVAAIDGEAASGQSPVQLYILERTNWVRSMSLQLERLRDALVV